MTREFPNTPAAEMIENRTLSKVIQALMPGDADGGNVTSLSLEVLFAIRYCHVTVDMLNTWPAPSPTSAATDIVIDIVSVFDEQKSVAAVNYSYCIVFADQFLVFLSTFSQGTVLYI